MFEALVLLLVVGMLVAADGETIAFVAGFVACVGVVLPMYLVIEMTGTLPIAAGADAERMTSDGLRRLRRQGWLTFDHIPFANGDVDHAVVGAEEAYALETKWSATPWVLDPPSERMRGALRSAHAGATKLERFLDSQTVGTPRDVHPVLVLWGRVQHGQLDGPCDVDGATVLRGADLGEWSRSIGSGSDDPRLQLRQTRAGIDEFLRARDRWTSQRDPVASAFENYGMRGLGEALGGAVLTWLVLGVVASALDGLLSETLTLVVLAATAAVAGALAMRSPRLRPVGAGLFGGSVLLVLVMSVLVVVSMVA